MAELLKIDGGDASEERAQVSLSQLLPPGWIVTTNIARMRFEIIGKRAEIDAVLICPYGIFAIELKNIGAVITPRMGEPWLNFPDDRNKNPFDQGDTEMYALKSLIKNQTGLDIFLEYLIVLSHPNSAVDWTSSNVPEGIPARSRVARLQDVQSSVLNLSKPRMYCSMNNAKAIIGFLKPTYASDIFSDWQDLITARASGSTHKSSFSLTSWFLQSSLFEYGSMTVMYIALIVGFLWIVNLGLKSIQPSNAPDRSSPVAKEEHLNIRHGLYSYNLAERTKLIVRSTGVTRIKVSSEDNIFMIYNENGVPIIGCSKNADIETESKGDSFLVASCGRNVSLRIDSGDQSPPPVQPSEPVPSENIVPPNKTVAVGVEQVPVSIAVGQLINVVFAGAYKIEVIAQPGSHFTALRIDGSTMGRPCSDYMRITEGNIDRFGLNACEGGTQVMLRGLAPPRNNFQPQSSEPFVRSVPSPGISIPMGR